MKGDEEHTTTVKQLRRVASLKRRREDPDYDLAPEDAAKGWTGFDADDRRKKKRREYLKRREHRRQRPPKGQPGLQPKMKHGGEMEMRMVRTLTRYVARKLRQGRPGRPSNEPAPTFDWEKVANNSGRRRIRIDRTRKNWWGRITKGGLT